MNERYFTLIIAIMAAAAIAFLPGAPLAAAEIITLKLMYAALLLAITFLLLYVMRGIKWDFHQEIISQHNIAGAIFVGSIIIGLALVLGK